MPRKININVGDHWAILGATGTGKTMFGRELINQYALAGQGYMPIYILDTKGDMHAPQDSDFKDYFRPGIGKRVIGNGVPDIINPRGNNFCLCWSPEEDIPENYNEFFKRIYKARRPALVFVDELSSVQVNRRGDLCRYHDILLKQGRGLGISVINLTQSPTNLGAGSSVIRQIMHLVRFRLNEEYDAKKLNGVMGRKVEEEPIDPFGFWYRNTTVPVRKMPPAYYKNYQEFFGYEE